METTSRRQFWIAFLVNFFLPGAGHIYAGAINQGVPLLIINIVGWAFCYSLSDVLSIVGLGAVILTWLQGLLTSLRVVNEFNNRIEKTAIEKKKEEERQITSEQFVTQINKINQLLAADVITREEFAAKKQELISSLQFRQIVGNANDFLLSIAPLKKNEVLSEDELKEIKKVLALQKMA